METTAIPEMEVATVPAVIQEPVDLEIREDILQEVPDTEAISPAIQQEVLRQEIPDHLRQWQFLDCLDLFCLVLV